MIADFTSPGGRVSVCCPDCGIEGNDWDTPEEAAAEWNTRPTPVHGEYSPCPTCHQYSHSIGDDALAKAFNHFQSMIAHPVRGHPMGDAFDEATRDAAQVLMAAARPVHGEELVTQAIRAVNREMLSIFPELSGDYRMSIADAIIARAALSAMPDQVAENERHRELGRRQGLEEAAKACEAERVDADETGQADDHAYNRAIEHCATSIRKLGEAE